MPIGSSSAVRTRASLMALGNAEGQGSITAAACHVTGLNQAITVSDEGGSVSAETLHGMIQINADIVPGDSAGRWPARPASSAWTPRATTPATTSRLPRQVVAPHQGRGRGQRMVLEPDPDDFEIERRLGRG
jgi:hypothetical protein